MAVVGAFGLSLGATWEVIEWLLDLTFGTNYIESETDTITDLIADGAGALVGAAVYVSRATVPGRTFAFGGESPR